jgi:hypothetical protein
VHSIAVALLAGVGTATASPKPPVPTREEAVVIATAHYLAAFFCTFGPCLLTIDNSPPSKRVVAALEDTALRASLSPADRKAGHVVTVALGRPRFVSASRAEVETSVSVNEVAFQSCTFPVAKVDSTWTVREKEGRCLLI